MFLKKSLPHWLYLSLILFVSACSIPDEFDPDKYNTTVLWKAGIEAPLIYGELSIKDLLAEIDEEDYLDEDDSGFLFFVYDTNKTIVASDYLPDIPDQEFGQVFFSVPYDLPPDSLGEIWGTKMFRQDESFRFERAGDERLDSIELKAGNVIIDVVSTIRHAGTLEIHSSAIDDADGQPFMEQIVISDSTGTFTNDTTINIEGYKLRLDNSDPDSSVLNLIFDFYLINSGNPILASEMIDIQLTFLDMEFQTVYGYAGTYDSLLIDNESMDIDVPEDVFEGTIKLYDPQLHLDIMNSLGIVFGIELLDVEGRFDDGSILAITIDPADNPIIVNAPSIDQVGQSVPTEVSIDRTNSNLHELATTDIRGLQYSVRALANPGGETDNFLQDTSKLSVNMEAIIPVHLRIEDVVLTDTFDFDMSGGDSEIEAEDVKSLSMKLDTRNGLPLDLEIQVYFTDSIYQFVDSLFDDTNRKILPSGTLDAEGKVIARSENSTGINLTRSQIQNIWDAKNIIFKAFVETIDNTGTVRDVKFYSGYSLYFKLGAGAEVSLSSD